MYILAERPLSPGGIRVWGEGLTPGPAPGALPFLRPTAYWPKREAPVTRTTAAALPLRPLFTLASIGGGRRPF